MLTIRKMKPSDRDAALALLAKWNMAPRAATAEQPVPERNDINIDNSFVAVDGQTIVGVCSYIVHSAQLAETASLAVDPKVKGQGLGYRLQVARLNEMRERGIQRVRTETDRPETIAWYQRKFPYRIVGSNPKKHAFSLAEVDTWTVLELDLTSWRQDPGKSS